MKVTETLPKPVPTPSPTYDLVGLTQDQFDVIVACLSSGEYGYDFYDDGKPGLRGTQVGNGTGVGGRMVYREIPATLREDSRARMTRSETRW